MTSPSSITSDALKALLNQAGILLPEPDSVILVTISTALPAGDNNIGNVDVATLPNVTLNPLPTGLAFKYVAPVGTSTQQIATGDIRLYGLAVYSADPNVVVIAQDNANITDIWEIRGQAERQFSAPIRCQNGLDIKVISRSVATVYVLYG